MYARSPIWSWGGATGYWGGAKSRSSSPPQAPTTTGVRLSAPTDPSARPCLECRKSLRRISRQTEFEFDCTWILRFSLHHLNVAIHHEQTKLIELLKNIKFEILKFNRDSPDFFTYLEFPECWLSLHWKLVFPWFFGLGKGKKIQNLTFATQSGAAPVM